MHRSTLHAAPIVRKDGWDLRAKNSVYLAIKSQWIVVFALAILAIRVKAAM